MLPISFNHDWSYCESSGNMIFDPRAAQAERIPVTLPHDATIHEKRSADAASGTAKGYYPNKDYDYFKTIDVPAEWADKRVWLRFVIYWSLTALIVFHCNGSARQYIYFQF